MEKFKRWGLARIFQVISDRTCSLYHLVSPHTSSSLESSSQMIYGFCIWNVPKNSCLGPMVSNVCSFRGRSFSRWLDKEAFDHSSELILRWTHNWDLVWEMVLRMCFGKGYSEPGSFLSLPASCVFCSQCPVPPPALCHPLPDPTQTTSSWTKQPWTEPSETMKEKKPRLLFTCLSQVFCHLDTKIINTHANHSCDSPS